MPQLITKLTTAILLLICLNAYGQQQVAVYSLDSVKAHLHLNTWIAHEKKLFRSYLIMNAQAKMDDYVSLYDNYYCTDKPEEVLSAWQDSLKQTSENLSEFVGQLEGVVEAYNHGLDSVFEKHLAEHLERIRSEGFVMIVEEGQILYHNPKTSSQIDISSQLIRNVNAQTESDAFLKKWTVFRTYWRFINLAKVKR